MGSDVSLTDKIIEKVESYGKCFSCCSSSPNFKRDDIDIQLLKQARRSDQSKRMLLDKIHNINDVNDIPLETDTLKLIIGLKNVTELNTGCSPNTTVDILPEFVATLPSLKEEAEEEDNALESKVDDFGLDHEDVPTSVPELHDVVSDAISIMTDENASRRDSIIEYNRSNKASSEMFNDGRSEEDGDESDSNDEMDSNDTDETYEEEEEQSELDIMPENEVLKHGRSRSHLMRRQSSMQWNEKEIEKLKDEMKGQLEFLKHSHTKSLSFDTDLKHVISPTMIIGNNESVKSQIFDNNGFDLAATSNDENNESSENDHDMGGSTHNLLRIKSIDKWDSDEIEEETDEIRQELVRLTSQ